MGDEEPSKVETAKSNIKVAHEDSDDDEEGGEEFNSKEGGDEFMAVKPWLGNIIEPSKGM
jgi:hypothetical protein